MNTKGVVFDFDGPIFDGRAAALQALRATTSKFEPPKALPHVLPLLRPRQLIALVFAESHLSSDVLEEICSFYVTQLQDAEAKLGIDADVRATIERLNKDGMALAIASSRPEAELRDHLRRLRLTELIKEVVGHDTTSTPKPDPEIIRFVARRLELEPTQLVLVGDSDADFDAARGAGSRYYHAAWSEEPCGRAAIAEGVVVLRTQRDMRSLLSVRDSEQQSDANSLPAELMDAINERSFSFYAGAGISVPSGIGGWKDHYLPQLVALDAQPLVEDHDFPEILQLLAADADGAKRVFDRFKTSFDTPSIRPNAYHFALQRSNAQRIWTSNYDDLFEKANAIAGLGRKTVVNDADLLQNFRDSKLVIKMNGDFQHARYADDLRWDMVLLQEQFDVAEHERREIWRLFEDDYRNSCILFIGVSFTDPVLRRIVTTVRQRIPRTRFTHFILVREAQDPAEAMRFTLYARNLARYNIQTLFFTTFDDISRFVARAAAYANSPVVGFSGDADDSAGVNLPNGVLTIAQIDDLCARLGAQFARNGYRVTSGHGPGVGVPAVSAAFDVNPTLARFYMRSKGTSAYRRTAPVIIVPGDSYSTMRERFVTELSLLVAVGGVNPKKEMPLGTIEEIELAMAKHIPVVLIPQGGGHAFDYRERFLARIDSAYGDQKLATKIHRANEKVWALSAQDLLAAVEGDMGSLLEDLVFTAFGAATAFDSWKVTW